MSGTTPQGHKKRSGIPIAPLETESAAGRVDAKRPPPSPMRRDCCGCGERYPRKDLGVFDLLGSSLSCDTTGLTPPTEYLCLRFTERLKNQQQRPKQVASEVSIPAFEETSITALLRPSADNDAPSAKEVHQAASAHGPGTPSGLLPKHSHHARSAISKGRWRQSTIPLSSRHL